MNKETILEGMSQLSVEDLLDIEPQIGRMITTKQKQVKKDLSAQFKEMAQQHGLTIDEILGGAGAKPAARKLEPKYRHPEDSSLTWVGRGKRPTWLQKLLDGGADLQDFAIEPVAE